MLWDLKGIADDDVRGAEVDGGWILYLLGKFGRGGGLGLTVVYFLGEVGRGYTNEVGKVL